jgi:Fe-S oxidoreductase
MNYLGASYGVLRKEKCTGDPVRRLGNDLLFQQLAESNLEALAQNKVKKIVSICPHCVRTIQEDWKEYGTPPEIEHHSEFLARFADRLPHGQALKGHDFSRAEDESESTRALATKAQEKIAFHDPCYLGRYRNVYDEPRAIASLAGDLVEAPRNRERGFCCGAGGGLAFLGEETGQRVSSNRAAELVATGAQTVAAACPFCNTMLRDALAATGEVPPQLLDIAQLAARSLPQADS